MAIRRRPTTPSTALQSAHHGSSAPVCATATGLRRCPYRPRRGALLERPGLEPVERGPRALGLRGGHEIRSWVSLNRLTHESPVLLGFRSTVVDLALRPERQA